MSHYNQQNYQVPELLDGLLAPLSRQSCSKYFVSLLYQLSSLSEFLQSLCSPFGLFRVVPVITPNSISFQIPIIRITAEVVYSQPFGLFLSIGTAMIEIKLSRVKNQSP